MPRQTAVAVENSFIKGLITEASGLNFPEKASTDTYNCVFSNLGTVSRRLGFDYETNKTLTSIDRASKAISTYIWNNAGGDGNTKVFVNQIGATLHFYSISSSTTTDPLSDQKLASTVTLSSFTASGGSFTATKECQYADGNGYLFVFHPDMDPIYCTYNAGTISAVAIDIQIRDFAGIPEPGVSDNFRSSSMTNSHNYNLLNQGWISQADWSATSSTSNNFGTGLKTWTVQTGLTISVGHSVAITGISGGYVVNGTGTVSSYNSGTGALAINVTSYPSVSNPSATSTNWTFSHSGTNYISSFLSAYSLYPANSDQWWVFKSETGAFAPSTTTLLATLDSGPAPKGHYILSAFYQTRTTVSTITSLTDITTTVRPRTGSWFAGRVWYAGVDASFAASGTAPTTTWTESIYFSQIIEKDDQFGRCYSMNDPTSEERSDLLPSDGGVVKIQGCGTIYKLFPYQNGLLVFANNGIWFITGSQGIGFTANDYTIVPVEAIKNISATSIVNVHGIPYFCNREGIYYLKQDQQGMTVQSLSFGTINTFYENIPYDSKLYMRGSFNPLDFTVKWIYKSTQETNSTTRYEFDRVLVFDVSTQAFYPWSLSLTSCPILHDIKYVSFGQGSTQPESRFMYLSSKVNGGSYDFTFSVPNNLSYKDWTSATTEANYISYFITGYKIRGDAMRKQQTNWIRFYCINEDPSSFDFQSRWNYAITGNTGKWSSLQRVALDDATNYAYRTRRLKVRGHGLVMQYKVSSVAGEPFDIIGWITLDSANTGI